MLPKWTMFFGDFRAGSDFLGSKPVHSAWAVPIFLDSVCRAFGQVVFANNPVSGLIILIALMIADPVVAGSGLFTTSVAVISSWVVGQPRPVVSAGLTAYSAVLVGTVTSAVHSLPGHHFNYLVCAALFLGAVLSVYVTSGLSNLLGSLPLSLPCLTLPFNIVAYLVLLSLRARAKDEDWMPDPEDPHRDPAPLNFTAHLDVMQVFSGSLRSAGQVYAVDNATSSALIFIAMLLCSPILTGAAFTGAMLGTLTGVMTLGKFELEQAYSGVLGYNSLLSAAAVGGVFYIISWRSTCAAIFNAVMTSLVQVALMRPLAEAGLSVLTMPFVISTLVFLATSSAKDGAMARPKEITFPEKHLSEYVTPVELP